MLTFFLCTSHLSHLYLSPFPLFSTPYTLYQKSTSSSASSEASETCQSVSECNSPTAVSISCILQLYWAHTHTHVLCIIIIFSLKRPLGSTGQLHCSLTWPLHGCWALWLRLVCPFRSLAHVHPSVPFALLSLTLAPSGLSLSYFLRPPHLTTLLYPTTPHPQQRFQAGRFVFICNFWVSVLLLYFLYFIAVMHISER